jgi:hypothetical protein
MRGVDNARKSARGLLSLHQQHWHPEASQVSAGDRIIGSTANQCPGVVPRSLPTLFAPTRSGSRFISVPPKFQAAFDVSLVKPRLGRFRDWRETRAIVAGRWLLQQRTKRAFHQNQLLYERGSCLSCPHCHGPAARMSNQKNRANF